ncbi:F-box domain-containing protein [Mycena venus]|uniref:F-box domain-containing protein n=1 Tax=Mycena venus TaxID=2733690 RepID=A0A8H6Y5P4_9AGAR|nr:F-box domain-containing protein [Mycena venus]
MASVELIFPHSGMKFQMPNDDLRTRLAELDKAIAKEEARLKKLKNDKFLVQQQLDSIVYPVLTLPLDVTLEILARCSSPPPHQSYGPHWCPTVLLQICRAWREIGLATPTVWTTINLDFTTRPGKHGGRWYNRNVERYLAYRVSLARDRPLFVSLGGGPRWAECLRGDTFSALLHRLAPRLQSLELSVDPNGLAKLDNNPPSFPLLQTLAINVDHGYHKPIKKLFRDAPRLQDVWTRSWGLIDFPWKQLTKFHGDRVSTEDAWYILQSGENLVECALTLVEDETQSSLHSDPCSHPHLQSLTLRRDFNSYSKEYLPFIEFLALPAMRSLHLCMMEKYDLEQISTFLSRHSSQLHTLSSFCGTTSIESLRGMAHLTNLEFWDGKISYIHEFFRELEDLKQRFLPQIQHISFKSCQFILDSADVEMFARGLTSRWDPCANMVAQIRAFHVDLRRTDEMTEYDMAEEFHKIRPSLAGLAALAKRGMHIYVGTRSANYVQGVKKGEWFIR